MSCFPLYDKQETPNIILIKIEEDIGGCRPASESYYSIESRLPTRFYLR